MERESPSQAGTPEECGPGPVIVVGAGVSGCACALALAERGVSVILVGSALDNVGLPSYGPLLHLDAGPASEVLPRRLRDVWERWSWEPADGSPFRVIDRRAVSLEMKQLIEGYAPIRLRQGLVTAVRAPGKDGATGGGPAVKVETAFGEMLEGVACVLAVGLGFHGRIRVGGQVLEGGRYGEVSADALARCLADGGLCFRQVERAVGARVALQGEPHVSGTRRVRLRPVRPASGTGEEGCDHGGAPPLPPVPGRKGVDVPLGPHEERRAAALFAFVGPTRSCAGGHETAGSAGDRKCVVVPDGLATGEWYVSSCCGEWRGGGVVTRPAHRVSASVVAGAARDGSLPGFPGVWVVGQAAGAVEYMESMESGVRAAATVAAALASGAGEVWTE
ncbi:MAG: hypothetical protein Kow00122_09240 [Thermoleophilia bacterium]